MRTYIVTDTIARKTKPVAPLVIAVAFNRENVTAALINNVASRPVAVTSVPFKLATTRGVTAAITAACVELVAHEARQHAAIKAVTLSAPGHLDPRSQRLTLVDWKGWTRVAFADQIARSLGEAGVPVQCADEGEHTTENLPVLLHTRLHTLAAAEAWTGAARSKSHVIYVEIDEQIRAGILIGGQPLFGADGLAGAIGWLAAGQAFKHEYEVQGCLNAEGGKQALVRRALEEYSGEAGSMLGSLIMSSPEQLMPETVLNAARGGETLARQVVVETCRWLGRGCANLISTFNPEAIVIGGALGRALNPYLEEMRTEAARWAHPSAASDCRIALAKLEETAPLIGAARLAWWQLDT
jgi:glucokinase